MLHFLPEIAATLIGLIVGFLIGWKIGMPFISIESAFSIGIYSGNSPFTFGSSPPLANPVLTADHVLDTKASFVADPFMVREQSQWLMFFEVFNRNTNKGDIGLAISDNALTWRYDRLVLSETFHLSYPYVFNWRGRYYMIPETCSAYSIRLYEAASFPHKWICIKTLLTGNYYDSSIVNYNDRWWLFTSDRDDVLRLFFADDLMGTWTEHPRSPVVLGNPHIARCAGRLTIIDDALIRFSQDCSQTYGLQVSAFRITNITPQHYDEMPVSQNPILKGTGRGWNAVKMHHIDPHLVSPGCWLACADGVQRRLKFGWKRFRTTRNDH